MGTSELFQKIFLFYKTVKTLSFIQKLYFMKKNINVWLRLQKYLKSIVAHFLGDRSKGGKNLMWNGASKTEMKKEITVLMQHLRGFCYIVNGSIWMHWYDRRVHICIMTIENAWANVCELSPISFRSLFWYDLGLLTFHENSNHGRENYWKSGVQIPEAEGQFFLSFFSFSNSPKKPAYLCF